MSEVYKIKHKVTGLFSTGGTTKPKLQWVEGGKVFHSVPALKAHLTAIRRSVFGIAYYKDAEIVEYEITPTRVLNLSLSEEI